MRKDQIKTYLLYGIIVAVIYYLWRGFQAASKVVMGVAELEAVAASSNVSKDRIAVCRDVAEKAEKAIWNTHNMFGVIPILDWRFDEDEDAVIQNLNRLNTIEEAKLTSQYYQQYSKGKSLRADVKKYLNNSEQAQIKTTIINSLD
ncbi:hypothetical protein [Chitinophaga vietnamensis]|uniref:hypothetical protein n=1 Tax=Chitinophaga vietnamensis TaxID=2593957 RepID=UPI001177E6F2|nr:hypothetical protein [Chitinophaga vietnamensis]